MLAIHKIFVLWLKIYAFPKKDLFPVCVHRRKIYLKVLKMNFDPEVKKECQISSDDKSQNDLVIRVHSVVHLGKAHEDIVQAQNARSCHFEDVTCTHHTFKFDLFFTHFVVLVEVQNNSHETGEHRFETRGAVGRVTFCLNAGIGDHKRPELPVHLTQKLVKP